MRPNSDRRHPGVTTLYAFLLLYIFIASVLSMIDPACRLRTFHLTVDGLLVGLIIAGVRLAHLLSKPKRLGQSAWSWVCLIRIMTGVELKYGLLGGYLLGITIAFIECW